jgi:hypothetical protein
MREIAIAPIFEAMGKERVLEAWFQTPLETSTSPVNKTWSSQSTISIPKLEKRSTT